MSKLRDSVIQQILEELAKTWFTTSGFDTKFPSNGLDLAIIRFKDNPKYRLKISEINDGFLTSECPGEFRVREDKPRESINECIRRIPEWSYNIITELRSKAPANNRLDQVSLLVDKMVSEKVRHPETRFEADDVARLEFKLNDIFSKFEELKKSNDITEKELRTVKSELAMLKEDLLVFPKGVWYRTASSRIIDLVKKFVKSDIGRDLIVGSAKKLLGI